MKSSDETKLFTHFGGQHILVTLNDILFDALTPADELLIHTAHNVYRLRVIEREKRRIKLCGGKFKFAGVTAYFDWRPRHISIGTRAFFFVPHKRDVLMSVLTSYIKGLTLLKRCF